MTGATPSQTVGPFFAFGLCARDRHELVDPARPDAIRVGGSVLDGEGAPVPDAMVEIWQRDEHGERPAGFGWGRCGTDADGRFGFVTVKPGGAGAPFVVGARVRPRPPEAAADADLLPRRAGERGRSAALRRSPRPSGPG